MTTQLDPNGVIPDPVWMQYQSERFTARNVYCRYIGGDFDQVLVTEGPSQVRVIDSPLALWEYLRTRGEEPLPTYTPPNLREEVNDPDWSETLAKFTDLDIQI